MKKLIILIIIIFPVIFNISLCGPKDSAAKYEGTTYYGDIFKDYDYLPEPINKRHELTLTNSYHPFPLDAGVVYEIGLEYIRNIPRWGEGSNSWFRSSFGYYLKISPGSNLLYSVGFILRAHTENPFYWGFNNGFFGGHWYESVYNSDKILLNKEFVKVMVWK